MEKSKTNIDKVVECMKGGGVALLPTDTVYGLAALPTERAAIERIFELKSRPVNFNLPIMVSSVKGLEALGLDLNANAMKLLSSEYVPGALSLVLGFKNGPLHSWLEGRDEVAVRIPDDEWLLAVLEKTGPMLVTSANKHKTTQTPSTVQEILEELNGEPEIVIDGGSLENVASTIINCRFDPPAIERLGEITHEALQKVLNNG